MGLTPGIRRSAFTAIVQMIVIACILGAALHVGRTVHADQSNSHSGKTIQLGIARQGSLYSVTAAVKNPAQLQGNDSVRATVNDAQGAVESKWLHAADLDFYLTLRPRSDGPVSVSFSPDPSVNLPEIAASMSRIPEPTGTAHNIGRGIIAAAPNGTWQTAQPFELGQTIFGSDDERP